MPPQSKLVKVVVQEGDVEWMDGGISTVQDKSKKRKEKTKQEGHGFQGEK